LAASPPAGPTPVGVAYVYGEDSPRGVSDNRMTKDEARRIAAGIAGLPELLGPTSVVQNPA
jgi:hypothetical protein